MTAVLWDDVDTRVPAPAARAPQLRAVPAPESAAAPKKVVKRRDTQPFGVGGDPLVEGAAWLLCIPLRQLYAALLRVGVLEVLA
ncbi:Rv1535 family protein [Mycobacterium botniense]|uniref:Uncharacterized protein n=1 Tax=Mycobacterium botniense TaxID=84962 RepID=A0A7I9Y0L6_9MYCO|nr:Rv1535 family protein [Mycobacterium botniense]GFG75612.1 hypothetical protein MBOT_29770 [Mycobacterium botniense]